MKRWYSLQLISMKEELCHTDTFFLSIILIWHLGTNCLGQIR